MSKNWGFISKSRSGCLELPGYKSRSYIYTPSIHVDEYDLPNAKVFHRLILTIHKSSNDIMGEVTIGLDTGFFHESTIPLHPNALHAILDNPISDVTNLIYRRFGVLGADINLEVKEINGHCFLVGKGEFNSSCALLSTKTVGDRFIGTLISKYSTELVLLNYYHDTLKSLHDVNKVKETMRNYRACGYKIDNKYRREALIEKIKSKKKRIADESVEFEKVGDEGADAMNTLSEKWGIDVDIDSICGRSGFTIVS